MIMYAVRIIIYLAALIASFFTFLYCEMWATALLLAIMILLPLVSGLLGLLGARKISYRVSAPKSTLCGEVFEILVSDTGKTKTLNYNITLVIDKGYGEPEQWKVGMFADKTQKHKMTAEHCCAIRCSVKSAYAYDALGLVRLRIRQANDTIVCVLPAPRAPEVLPEYSLAMHEIYVPKYGGGSAEVHDLRTYRPGDSMRDIHWKLSAKTDQLIVREPQKPVCSSILITFDLEAPSVQMDSKIAHLLWISGWMVKNNVEHDVCWLDPADRQVRTFNVTLTSDPVTMVRDMMIKRVTEPLPSIAEMPFAKVDWHYHISGEVQQ